MLHQHVIVLMVATAPSVYGYTFVSANSAAALQHGTLQSFNDCDLSYDSSILASRWLLMSKISNVVEEGVATFPWQRTYAMNSLFMGTGHTAAVLCFHLLNSKFDEFVCTGHNACWLNSLFMCTGHSVTCSAC